MAKLKLAAEPTFKVKVGIPVPGAKPSLVEFTFKHRTRDEVTEWLALEQPDATGVIDCVLAWDLDDEFTPENVERLLQSYPGSCYAIITAYLEELRGSRAKN